jgi:hypothetical protein
MFAHRVISFAQCWISRVKIGAMLVLAGVLFGEADVTTGVISESAVIRQVIINTAKIGSE